MLENSDVLNILGFCTGILGIGLSLMIYHRQTKTDDDIQKMICTMHDYVSEQKKIQDSIRATSFRHIGANLENAKREIDRFTRHVASRTFQNVAERAIHLDDQLMRTNGFKSHAKTIYEQLEIARALIDAPTAQIINEAAAQLEHLSISSADHTSSRIFDVDIPDSIENWLSYATSVEQTIDRAVAAIPKKML